MATPIVQSSGSPPVLANLSVLIWPWLNILLLIAIVTLVFLYINKKDRYRKQLLVKLDQIILLLQPKDTEDK